MDEKNEALKVFKSFLRILYEIFKTLGFIAIIFVVMRFFLIQPFIVDGNSMEPNYHNKEYLLIDKLSYRFREPQRGEVVIFNPPNRNVYYIKRIIGLPGDKIVIDQDKVYIYNTKNPEGIELNETYLTEGEVTTGSITQVLQEGEYYVLGDNRNNSSDSREFGVLPKKNITGRVFITIYPFNQFGLIKKPQYQNFTTFLPHLNQISLLK